MNFNAFEDQNYNSSSSSEEEPYIPKANPSINESGPSNCNFIDLLVTPRKYQYKLKKYKYRRIPADLMNYEVDDLIRFKHTTSFPKTDTPVVSCLYTSTKNSVLKRYLKRKQLEKNKEKNVEKEQKIYVNHSFDIVEWEKDIIYDLEERTETKNKDILITEYVNNIFDEEKWEDQIVYDVEDLSSFKKYLTLGIEDPNLIFEKIDDKIKIKNKKKTKEVFIADKPIKSKYNISNDKYYNVETTTKNSLGHLGVQHSVPALKLNPRFYKTFLAKDELRNFHRPPFPLSKGFKVSLTNISEDSFQGTNIIKRATELTLKDQTKFALFEYSEEIPILMMNAGMVSLVTTFYRKNGPRDDFTPHDSSHITFLDMEDPSPFFGFGDVKPGTSLMAITNNLFKAPVFKHKSNDFICILEEKGPRNYIGYVRKITNLFCVGQTLPLEEVFSPHSRKHNVFCKNRLKVAAYRIFYNKENPEKKMKICDLDQLFPHFSEGSKRKWLKEYANCIKKGKDNIWVLKPGSSLLSEEDLRNLVTPENVCQYESMLAGERRLKDAGYEFQGNSEEEEDDDEIALSPWNLSRNFVNASNGRGMLQISGPGDPTGIGEGFSFLKYHFRKGTDVENKKMMSEIQLEYREDIERIWNKQIESLSSTLESIIDKHPGNSNQTVQNNISKNYEKSPKIEFPFDSQNFNSSKNNAIASSDNIPTSSSFLTIRRKYIINNEINYRDEILTDSRLIRAYLKEKKRVRTEEKRTGLRCGSCGQIGHMKTNKTCPNFIVTKKESKKSQESTIKGAKNTLSEMIVLCLNILFSIPSSEPFHRPVSTKKFTDYKNFVLNPIDLGTIKSKARQNKYLTFQSFISDVNLMLENCKKYNGADHSLTKMAENMVELSEKFYEEKKQEMLALEIVLNPN
ncbi:subunit TAF1 of transcription initiation factor TFIID [Hamiltosporidium tvaerminnensis]|uniref:Subunit TAF1 of transcription initiation factor TFIID n=1 Tax=Hamiltosporidium tvaerminnensis TaxID=1176355 RepID=A0A4Q9LX16_9MICR|nr:subunit TAF1 of transcription initiation factor TFIID [Hamiltosporidium tvaerminnensis]